MSQFGIQPGERGQVLMSRCRNVCLAWYPLLLVNTITGALAFKFPLSSTFFSGVSGLINTVRC